MARTVKELFLHADKDGSGILSREEFGAACTTSDRYVQAAFSHWLLRACRRHVCCSSALRCAAYLVSADLECPAAILSIGDLVTKALKDKSLPKLLTHESTGAKYLLGSASYNEKAHDSKELVGGSDGEFCE